MIEKVTIDNISRYIDHTNVKADATTEDTQKLCQEAQKYGFHSVCVTPYRVNDARKFLGNNSNVEIICVLGFPFGFTTTKEKVNEAKIAKTDGATEFDMVINIGAVKENNWKFIKGEIRKMANMVKPNGLKVIMEIGFLRKNELIKACKVAKSAGAAFVKTSTGYGPRVPNPKDIRVMRMAVGPKMGVKASGGIHDLETAIKMIEAGATRIGTSSGLQIIGVEKPPKRKFRHHGKE